MKRELDELEIQLNYVCYDGDILLKLSKVWDAFFELKKLSLPPAEGAGYDMTKVTGILLDEAVELRRRVDELEQPPAEGAEEILKKYTIYCKNVISVEGKVWVLSTVIPRAMNDFATLHAQKIADKMVGEKDDDVFDKMNCLIGYLERWLNNPQSNNPPAELRMVIDEAIEYLKTREK